MAFLSPSSSKIVKALGVVFGDIGTSPIYTIGAILLFILPTIENILGLLSLIVWSLIIIISVQYAWLAMNLGSKGEGGTIVLKGLLTSNLKNPKAISFVSVLTLIGVALFIGDGVITPAISILSAVEGIRLIPGFAGIWGGWILLTGICIACALFIFQKKGTERVAWAFGPIMVVWFLSLAVTGIISIASAPQVLLALNPSYAIGFLMQNGLGSFIILSAVLLCVTGGEALYADMGHLGKEPIVKGWYCIFPALVLSYFGQGAYVLNNPEAHSILFSMVQDQAALLYVPFLLLSICATIIASQAMISGMFSIMYQGMMTQIIPKMKIEFTSPELRSQIYIDAVNWMLLAAVTRCDAGIQNLGKPCLSIWPCSCRHHDYLGNYDDDDLHDTVGSFQGNYFQCVDCCGSHLFPLGISQDSPGCVLVVHHRSGTLGYHRYLHTRTGEAPSHA